jgi:hypothetical protein
MKKDVRKAVKLIHRFFKGDKTKVALWFTTTNPGLGNVAPLEMIRVGRIKKLLDFIKSALKENRP